jgi:CheY-like chemotaxis protein
MSLRNSLFLTASESCARSWGCFLSSDTGGAPVDPASEDLFAFVEESSESSAPKEALTPWVLLIVDDEPQVHEATTLTLRRGRVANRPFRFLHAHSAAEAKEIICAEAHIDLVLLDVMMETRDAGFKLVQELRGPLARSDLKILIRSGQPGAEQEHTIAQRHPVEGYMQKTQQTYSLMMEVIHNILLGTNPDQGSAN